MSSSGRCRTRPPATAGLPAPPGWCPCPMWSNCLPILGYGLRTNGPGRESPPEDVSGLGLPALLSRVLLAFATEFERGSDVALAISANLLRVLDQQGARTRDLPPLAGMSKQAISIATGIAGQLGLAVVEPDPVASRGQVVSLTPRGRRAQDTCHAGCSRRSRMAGGSASVRPVSAACARHSIAWPPRRAGSLRRCGWGWSPTPTDGGRRSAGHGRCRITRWCCTAAASPTAAESPAAGPVSRWRLLRRRR